MPYTRKYVRGEPFASTAELVEWLETPAGYVLWNGLVRHPLFMAQQKLEVLRRLVAGTRDGQDWLYRAEPNPAYAEAPA